MQILKDKLAYLREHEDFSIVYTRPPRRQPTNSPEFSLMLGTSHLSPIWKHQYRMGRCLTEVEILDFERTVNLSLPEDYRRFLMEVGNGGAGPEYRLFELEPRRVMTTQQHYEDALFLEEFSPSYPPKPAGYKPECPPVPTNFSQFMSLADGGGTCVYVLILDGSERGKIYDAELSGDPILSPVDKLYGTPRKPSEFLHEAVTFYEWYNLWLDRQIAELHERIYAIG